MTTKNYICEVELLGMWERKTRDMKRLLIAAAIATVSAAAAHADIVVKIDPSIASPEYEVQGAYIADLVKPRMERPEPSRQVLNTSAGEFTIPLLEGGTARYLVPVSERDYLTIYAQPGENIVVNVTSLSPLGYTASGSRLMEDIAAMDDAAANLVRDYQHMMLTGAVDEKLVAEIESKYEKIFTDYIQANPMADAVPYALMQLEGEPFMQNYTTIAPSVKEGPLGALVENQRAYVERKLGAERRKAELASGEAIAPNFSFNNAEGKPVSLSDFKGKWVIIDFWGTWCPWCIKGFPELKQAYAEYGDKLVILGVACNDKYEAWLNGLKKYELPWVNVYNPIEGGGPVLEEYAVEGFPTKVIVSPEGKIANITSGHDPEFFNILKTLVK